MQQHALGATQCGKSLLQVKATAIAHPQFLMVATELQWSRCTGYAPCFRSRLATAAKNTYAHSQAYTTHIHTHTHTTHTLHTPTPHPLLQQDETTGRDNRTRYLSAEAGADCRWSKGD